MLMRMGANQAAAPTKGERTRARILAVAQAAVAELGYERASMREIARRAEVDPALLRLYFGSKEQLLLRALTTGLGPPPALPAGERRLGETALRTLAGRWEEEQPGAALRALVRAGMTNDRAAALLRKIIEERVIEPTADALDAPDRHLRAALVAAFVLGLGVYRHLLRLPYVADAPVDEIEALAVPAVDALLRPGQR